MTIATAAIVSTDWIAIVIELPTSSRTLAEVDGRDRGQARRVVDVEERELDRLEPGEQAPPQVGLERDADPLGEEHPRRLEDRARDAQRDDRRGQRRQSVAVAAFRWPRPSPRRAGERRPWRRRRAPPRPRHPYR